MTIEVGKVYTFKLNSGEELVAKVNCECTGNYITIEEPVSIAPGPQGGIGLVPSMFTADPSQSVTLNTNSITMYSETEENVKNKYIEAITGIKVPDKKIILG
jgi:hypothetical protein